MVFYAVGLERGGTAKGVWTDRSGEQQTSHGSKKYHRRRYNTVPVDNNNSSRIVWVQNVIML
eukprot:1087688-Heterocapsa_arctica.AAC.1